MRKNEVKMTDELKQELICCGVDYDTLVKRFMGRDDIAEKFLVKFLDDKTIEGYERAVEENSAKEAVKRIKVPVIFFHGESDAFVPCDMSKENYKECAAPKKLVTVAGAGHGLSFPVDEKNYLKEVADFFDNNGVPTKVL